MNIYIIGFIFISLLGTLLHFTYELSNKNKIIGIFSAVNESTWEHIKMALTATFIWSLVDGFIMGVYNNYFFSKVVGILIIIILIPLIFYSIKYIFGRSFLVIDILTFYVSIFISQYVEYVILNSYNCSYIVSYLSVVLLFVIIIFWALLTTYPIKNFLFLDPITKKYGFNK